MFNYQSPFTNGGYPYGQLHQPFTNPNYPQGSASEPTAGIKWVNGIESATIYNMPPNSEELLMDQNANRFYIKKTDASGQYTIAAFDFAPAQEPQSQYQIDEEIRADLDTLRAKIENIEEQLGVTEPSTEGDSDGKHTGKQQHQSGNNTVGRK